MKKITIVILFVLAYGQSYSQSHTGNHNAAGDDNSKWNVFGNFGDDADWLGTTNSFPLIFKTNNTQRMSLDANGVFNLVNLAGTGSRMLKTDASGNLIFLPAGSSGQFLQSDGTWGNLPSSATAFSVNGSKLSLSAGTFLGIGTSNPAYPLDVAGTAHISNDLIVDGGVVLTDINKTATGIQLNIGGSASISGNLRLANLGGSPSAVLSVDNLGNVSKGAPVLSCVPGSPQWSISGDNFFPYSTTMGNFSEASIGTCNSYDFILKANATNRIWIKTDGKIGFGTSSPVGDFNFNQGVVRLTGGNTYGGPQMVWGTGGETVAGANFGDWAMEYSTALATPGLNFWKPFGSTNGGFNNFLFLADNGNVGVRTDNPTSRLTVDAWSGDGIKNLTSNVNSKALLVIDNTIPTSPITNFIVYGSGKTQIGSLSQNTSPVHYDALLTVNGKAVSKSLFVTMDNWADDVFAPGYKLPDLYNIEAYYKANKHLAEIPSEKEVLEKGIDVGEMNRLLLKKVEELTVLMVQQQKEIDALKKRK